MRRSFLRNCIIFFTLAAVLTGCGGAAADAPGAGSARETAFAVRSYYDGLDLSQYIELAPYKELSYVPYGDPGRNTAEYGDTVTVQAYFQFPGEELPRELINTFVLGDSGLPDPFDALLDGAEPGEERRGDVVFPAGDARYGDMSGRTAEVTASILVLDLSYYRDLNASELLDRVAADSTILQWPEEVVAMYASDYEENYRAFAAEYQMSLDSYLQTFFGFSEAELAEQCLAAAQQAVREDMTVYRIWELEEMQLTAEDLENCKPLWLQTYGYDTEEDMPASWDDAGVRQSLVNMAVFRKVRLFLLENAVPEQ
ncbi:MAG: hypothetical protein IKI65_04685 [Firmicutes bacterium]|nr:hypothetical protein [Bacillota bacterium]